MRIFLGRRPMCNAHGILVQLQIGTKNPIPRARQFNHDYLNFNKPFACKNVATPYKHAAIE